MKLVNKAINYLKALSAETITNAKSGHLGVSLGASSILFALFILKKVPKQALIIKKPHINNIKLYAIEQ